MQKLTEKEKETLLKFARSTFESKDQEYYQFWLDAQIKHGLDLEKFYNFFDHVRHVAGVISPLSKKDYQLIKLTVLKLLTNETNTGT